MCGEWCTHVFCAYVSFIHLAPGAFIEFLSHLYVVFNHATVKVYIMLDRNTHQECLTAELEAGAILFFLWVNTGSKGYSEDEKSLVEKRAGRGKCQKKKRTVSQAVIISGREQSESTSLTCSVFTWIYSENKYLPAMFSMFISPGLLSV